MKLATIRTERGEEHLAAVLDSTFVDLTEATGGVFWASSLAALLQGGPERVAEAAGLLETVGPGARRPLAEARFLAPLPRPPKNVFCLGRNYPEHIAEGARAWGEPEARPKAPIVFTKPYTAITGPGAPIRRPPDTQQLDYEGELAVIIGRRGRGIAAAQAGEYVFGYTLLNDVSARDLQRLGPQWFLGKGCDTFCPMGPWVLLADPAVPQPDFEIRVTVNGSERQRFRTRQMIFPIPEILAALSRNVTLEPGDVIATGTGPGCGFALDPPAFLQVGDRVAVEADGLGKLENFVVAAEEP